VHAARHASYRSIGFVPNELRSAYGGRANVGGGIFVTLRPAIMAPGTHTGQPHVGGAMIMVQTALDPAKLSCSPAIDPATAPSVMYGGKTYFFCSTHDRDIFLKDPKMSLSMSPPKQ
jgi:YHS domain-containing protein